MYLPLCGSGCILCIPGFPTGRPYHEGGPGKTRGIRVYPPLCGSGSILCIPGVPTGRPYPPNSQGRTGGTRVSTPLCGEAVEDQSYPTPPPVAPMAQTS